MKVTYFDMYGRAEIMRMMLWKAGVPFEDVRIQFADLAALKPSLEYGQLPQLELDDGTKLVQTEAILSFLAATYGFKAEDPMDCYKSQHIISYTSEDFITRKFMKWWQAAAEDKPEIIESLFATDVPALFAMLEKKLGSVHKFILGDKLTTVDFMVGCLFQNLILNPKSLLADQF